MKTLYQKIYNFLGFYINIEKIESGMIISFDRKHYDYLETISKEKAIEYLNRAYLLNDYALISIKVNKLFDPLRNENGFRNLLSKMGVE